MYRSINTLEPEHPFQNPPNWLISFAAAAGTPILKVRFYTPDSLQSWQKEGIGTCIKTS